MKAMDVMVRDVVTVKPETDVASAIKLLIEHDISALPVVDDGGRVAGSPRCWKSTASSAFPSSRTASWSAS
jgi:CBS-domain-containing membrane protein